MGELKIGVMNVTSLRPHLAGVLGAQVDVRCLQEVRLTAGGQAALAPLAEEEGWSPYWGAPTLGAQEIPRARYSEPS